MKNADMPAMPVVDQHGMPFNDVPGEVCSVGLTKREHLAAMAMQGLLANDGAVSRISEAGDDNHLSPENVMSSAAVSIADALLAELERSK